MSISQKFLTAPVLAGALAAVVAIPVTGVSLAWAGTSAPSHVSALPAPAMTGMVPAQGPGAPLPTSGRPTSNRPTSGRPTSVPPVPAPSDSSEPPLPPSSPMLPPPISQGVFRGAIDVTPQTNQKLLDTSKEKLVVINASTENCQQCEMLAPVLRDKQNLDKDWLWGFLDTRRQGNAFLVSEYGNPWLPTLVAFKDGKEVSRLIGFDGTRAEVYTWLNDLRAGKTPPSPESFVGMTTAPQMDWVKKESTKRPVIFRLHREAANDAGAIAQGKLLSSIATGHKGAFLLVNVDSTSPFGAEVAAQLKTVSNYNALTVMYDSRTWQAVVPNLVGTNQPEKRLREYVNTVLTTNFPGGSPEDKLAPGAPAWF